MSRRTKKTPLVYVVGPARKRYDMNWPLEAAARRAAARIDRDDSVLDFVPPNVVRLHRRPGIETLEKLSRKVRQPRLRLETPLRRATLLAVQQAAGGTIGRRKREKLRGRIPEVVRETLCKKTRQRREVLHAKKKIRKGAGARRRQQRSLFDC